MFDARVPERVSVQTATAAALSEMSPSRLPRSGRPVGLPKPILESNGRRVSFLAAVKCLPASRAPGDVNNDGRADIFANGFTQNGEDGLAFEGRVWVFDGKATVDNPALRGKVLYGRRDRLTATRAMTGSRVALAMMC